MDLEIARGSVSKLLYEVALDLGLLFRNLAWYNLFVLKLDLEINLSNHLVN